MLNTLAYLNFYVNSCSKISFCLFISLLLVFSNPVLADPPEWSPVPNLQYNMQVVAKLQLEDNIFSVNEQDIVAGFVGEECRGLASPLESLDGTIFLTLGSNLQDGEVVVFKAYLSDIDTIVDINETLEFENMAEVGTFLEPFIFTFEYTAPPVYYTIMASSGNHGSIEPEGSIQVIEGNNQTFAIFPEDGYSVEDVLIDGSSVGAVTSYEFQNVTGNHTIHAAFALNTYTIVAASGPGGIIQPSGVVTVNHGSNQSFNMVPNTGYHVSNVDIDGVSIGAVTSYEFVNITTNHSIQVSFAINSYTITASAGGNGTINPSGTISLEHGSNQQFTITPEQGFHIDDVLVDGISVGAVGSYEFVHVVQNHSIHATFAMNTYVINASSNDYGTIEPAGEVIVTHGSNQLFTFTPQPNYAVKEVIIDNINHGELDSYEFVNIAADHSIHVVFDLIESLVANQFDGLALKLHPNPVHDILLLQIEQQPTTQTALTYRIIQLDGSILMHHEIDDKLTNISVDALAPGMYFVQLLKKGQVIKTEKLVKAH